MQYQENTKADITHNLKPGQTTIFPGSYFCTKNVFSVNEKKVKPFFQKKPDLEEGISLQQI